MLAAVDTSQGAEADVQLLGVWAVDEGLWEKSLVKTLVFSFLASKKDFH